MNFHELSKLHNTDRAQQCYDLSEENTKLMYTWYSVDISQWYGG